MFLPDLATMPAPQATSALFLHGCHHSQRSPPRRRRLQEEIEKQLQGPRASDRKSSASGWPSKRPWSTPSSTATRWTAPRRSTSPIASSPIASRSSSPTRARLRPQRRARSHRGREPRTPLRPGSDAHAPLHDRGRVQRRGNAVPMAKVFRNGESRQAVKPRSRPSAVFQSAQLTTVAVLANVTMTTPMMQQYREAKERHPGMILLFRMGDFYELFDEDAELVSRVLGLTLTSRDKTIPMAGFPHHSPRNPSAQAAARRPSRRHLRSGRGPAPGQGARPPRGHPRRHARHPHRRRPARSAPVQSPGRAVPVGRPARPRSAWPGWNCRPASFRPPTCRATGWPTNSARLAPVRVLGRGEWLPTAEAAELLESPARVAAGADRHRPARLDLRPRLGPRRPCSTISASPPWPASASTTSNPAWPPPGPCCSTCRKRSRRAWPTCADCSPMSADRYLFLDEVTRRSLELTRTLRDGGREGSLLAVLDRTVTPMGARLLHEWLLAPLADRGRHRGPARRRRPSCSTNTACAATCASCWRGVRPAAADGAGQHRAGPRRATWPPSAGRCVCCRASRPGSPPGDRRCCTSWKRGWSCAPTCARRSTPPWSTTRRMSPREGGVIRRGYDAELDELHEIATQRQGVDRPLPGRRDHTAPASPA